MGLQTGTATLEISKESSQKLKLNYYISKLSHAWAYVQRPSHPGPQTLASHVSQAQSDKHCTSLIIRSSWRQTLRCEHIFWNNHRSQGTGEQGDRQGRGRRAWRGWDSGRLHRGGKEGHAEDTVKVTAGYTRSHQGSGREGGLFGSGKGE